MPHDTDGQLLVEPVETDSPVETGSPFEADSPAGNNSTDSVSTSSTSKADDLRSLEAGLDRLQTDPEHAPGAWQRFTTSVLPPILFVIALVAAWQLYVVIAQPRPDIVPGPVDVFNAMALGWESGRLQTAVITSLERGVVGFLIAVVVGTPLGLLLAEVKPLRRAVGPIISGLQVLPSVAWVPAAILWFGLTDATVYFVVLMGATPSIVNGLIAGVEQVPPQLRRVGTVLGAGRTRLATLVVLPAALPGYVAGLKQGWAFSWRSLMAAEIIAVGGTIGFGLGSMLQQSRELADIGGVLATVLVILFIGVLIELVFFAPLERRMLRRRGLLQGGTR
ncbi:ABC transporter permease [Agromyces cerinus]|uniref:NitT/TauT family transport system permease protein n=1 Tax=Agromyces cerinus subsp. cerinus TaxID=232089 RepID=A0A1N6DGK7_9MICO|nr:ABC transporter permease [Agromyces cerinus]SIN69857.1 NitT/TauT family transport system permease protein [Agromyces cerinus subsp. cerinus]